MMIISVEQSSYLVPTHWGIGYCTHCDCYEAIRMGKVVETVRVSGIKTTSTELQRAAICDCCERETKRIRDTHKVPLTDWSYALGLQQLFEWCAPQLRESIPDRTSDDAMRKLMVRIRRRTSLTGMNVGRGLLIGGLFGVIIGLIVGYAIAQIAGFDNATNTLILSGVLGGVVGGIVGCVIDVVLNGRKFARVLVFSSYQKYRLDPERLLAVAQSFPSRIRNAAQEITMAVRT